MPFCKEQCTESPKVKMPVNVRRRRGCQKLGPSHPPRHTPNFGSQPRSPQGSRSISVYCRLTYRRPEIEFLHNIGKLSLPLQLVYSVQYLTFRLSVYTWKGVLDRPIDQDKLSYNGEHTSYPRKLPQGTYHRFNFLLPKENSEDRVLVYGQKGRLDSILLERTPQRQALHVGVAGRVGMPAGQPCRNFSGRKEMLVALQRRTASA